MSAQPAALSADIFRPAAIRGVSRQTLTPPVAELIGLALGSEARARGFKKIVVARDGRLPSQDFAGKLMAGLNDAGLDVLDLGLAPIGVMQWAAHAEADGCGVLVGAGRSPAAWNGFKPMLGGRALLATELQALHARIAAQDFTQGSGDFDREGREAGYMAAVVADVKPARPVRVVLDHGNGATAVVGTELFKQLGCAVHEIWPQVDGNFPNHFPDPTQHGNLVDVVSVQRSSQQGELGIAFSADGAALGVVDMRGYPVEPDRVLMLLAADLLQRQPGALIMGDARMSERVAAFVKAQGGRYMLAPVGHAQIESAMREAGAALAADATGHFYFADRWHRHDDALYAAARLVEAAARLSDGATVQATLDALPKAKAPAEIRLKSEPGVAEALVGELAAQAFADATPTHFKGSTEAPCLRLVWPDALCVARAGTTTPGLVLRFEGRDATALQRAQASFKQAFAVIRPGVELPF